MDDKDHRHLLGELREAPIDSKGALPSFGESSPVLGSTYEGVMKSKTSYMEEDDKFHASEGAVKKEKGSRIVGWGLRKFSTIVCNKVRAKGMTTYNEVADEIIADLASLDRDENMQFEFDEKNIRRRVYDAFNVLMAMNIIAKDRKEIRWAGFPATKGEHNELKKMHLNLINKISAKQNFLNRLVAQLEDLQNLMRHNQEWEKAGIGNVHSEGLPLPFLLVHTKPNATVEIEISEDRQFVTFDFNGTPFTLHDNTDVLRLMKLPKLSDPKHKLW